MKQFWALISTDEELTTKQQVDDICEEIQGNVAHVVTVQPQALTDAEN